MLAGKKYQKWMSSTVRVTVRRSCLDSKYFKNTGVVLALTEEMKQKKERFKISSGGKKDGSAKTIIFVGGLHPVKGVQYLIEAMAIVHLEMPDVKLVIVGDGVERARLEELAERLNLNGCIQFAGQVPQESIPRLMHQADVFVLSSLSEGLPVVLLEAMAAGLSIVATNVGGIPDIVEEGVNGYLVNAKNPDELADRLLVLLQNDEIREEISANNREKAELYTWDKVAIRVEKE